MTCLTDDTIILLISWEASAGASLLLDLIPMINNRLYFISSIAFVVGCTSPQNQPESELKISKSYQEIDDAYHFYTIGDWGRNGDHGQKELAVTMNMAAQIVEPEIIISTGDNFYPNGIASVQDPYWKSSFEDIYRGAELFCPWYAVLGNHDYRGNIQAQIDYSQVSKRWNMPGKYYLKDIETDDGTSVRIVFIDTPPLDDEYYLEEKYAQVHDQDTTLQLQWMDSVLAVEADWKIVIGHHPLYSGGKRTDEKSWVRTHVEPLLTKHSVDMYFAGHEHDLQHIKNPDLPTHHIVSGAGSEARPTGMMEYSLFAKSIQGFVSSSITQDSIYNQFVDTYGEVIYSFTLKKN